MMTLPHSPPLVPESPMTEQRLTEAEQYLRDSEAQYRSIFENAQEGIYQTTPDGGYLKVNPSLARIYGYDDPEALISGLTDIAAQLYVDTTARDLFKHLMERDGRVHDFEAQIRRRDGSIIWITENARCVRDDHGRVRYYEGTVEDITDRKRAEEEIRLLAKVFESSAEGIALICRDRRVEAVNPAWATLTGCQPEAVRGQRLVLAAPGQHEKGTVDRALQQVDSLGHWSGELICARVDGAPFPAEITITAVRDPAGLLTHYVVALSDISRRKEDEQHIRFHADYDTLTRLPNRRMVLDRLAEAMKANTAKGGRGCLLFLDLDRFKAINDTYGHAAGDELLKLVGRRLRHCVRSSDTVGRLGGDEFVVLVPEAGTGNTGTFVAEKILYSLTEPFTLMGSEQFCIPSIGIAYFPDHGDTVEELLRNADTAMYHAKQEADRHYWVYDPAMASRSLEQVNLENDLRMALARGELELFYQPKVEAGTLRLVGAEALVRWRHPTLGLVSPAQFIPLAEETGLILSIGRWVLRRAALQLVRWQVQGLNLPSVSVNVSARQFADRLFLETVQQTLADTAIAPEQLDLEVTESVMSGDVEKAIATLTALKNMGVTLSMDDFGTGYSSLNYLRTFPIDTLKIDQTFVRDVTGSQKDAAIATTIITLARNLQFSVVAEGVETEGQAEFLIRQGCDVFQGYWISRPLPPSEFGAWMRVQAKAKEGE